ncbi:MAG: helix-turn-helix transcriptional regulator [Clostridia bacterium]|nr:helix-turn-helix transcriptional regulator [Clostridia bacterium]
MNRLYLFDLLRMMRFIEQNFRKHIDIEDIAHAAGYSSWHCRRIFKQYVGETLSRRLQQVRLEAGKQALRQGASVAEAAASVGFSTREGFAKAFRSAYGISPGRYAKGEETKERYETVYEYRMSPEEWNRGKNPTADGLWEFSYYDPKTDALHPMEWNGEYFEAPYLRAETDDPTWYCRNRYDGYSMHPGNRVHAVKSFLCPKSGLLEYFISLGRTSELYDDNNPCAIQLLQNGIPLDTTPSPLILSDRRTVFLTGTCRVAKGDRISIREDAMEHMGRDRIMLYRQQMAYLK